MAIIVKWKGNLPKRFEEYIIYKLEDIYVLKEFSGITKGLLKNPRYAKCLQNANEFGRLSALSKLFRYPLETLLPRTKKMEVVNSLAQAFYKIMVMDVTSVRGERNLATAFENDSALALTKRHDFNPDMRVEQVLKVAYRYVREANAVCISPFAAKDDIVFPEDADCVLVRFHRYCFDFREACGVLVSSEPAVFSRDSKLKTDTVLAANVPVGHYGVLFSMVSVQFYNFADGCFVPVVNDGRNAVRIVGAERIPFESVVSI